MNSTILKSRTQDLHDRTEHVMHSSLLFNNQFTTEHYKFFILKSYQYLLQINNSIDRNWIEFNSILQEKKNALLIDLKHIGIHTKIEFDHKPQNKDKYYSLGLIYIVLGAMLGNKMILKKLREYDTFKDYPFAYLSNHQEELPNIWKNFQAIINQLEESDLEEVIKGARAGYELFGQ